MKGRNLIAMNEDSMIEAVQEYMDKRATPDGKVWVKSIRATRSGSVYRFEVMVSDNKDDVIEEPLGNPPA